jgi:hypothetical protein
MIEEYRTKAEGILVSSATRRRVKALKYDASDALILEKFGLGETYKRDVGGIAGEPKLKAAWDEVFSVLENPLTRVAMDCAFLCRYSPEDLSQILPEMLGTSCTSAGVALYRKYFFDYSSMSRSDWKDFLALTEDVPYVHVRYYTALTKPKEETLFLVGIPTKPDFSRFLKNVLATADFKFKYYSRLSSPDSDAQAKTWAKVGFEAGVRYEKVSTGDVTDFSSAVQTEFDMLDPTFQTIDNDLLSQVKTQASVEEKPTSAPALPAEQTYNMNDV